MSLSSDWLWTERPVLTKAFLASCCVLMGTLTVPLYPQSSAQFDVLHWTPQWSPWSSYVKIWSSFLLGDKWQLSVVPSWGRLWQQRGEETDTDPTIKTPALVSFWYHFNFATETAVFILLVCLFVFYLVVGYCCFSGCICFFMFVRFIFLNHNYFATYPLASQWLTHISFQLKAR